MQKQIHTYIAWNMVTANQDSTQLFGIMLLIANILLFGTTV